MMWCTTHNSGFNWRNGEEQFGPRCDAYRLMSWPHPPQHESDCQMVGVPEWDEVHQLLWDTYTALRELHICYGLDEGYPESANEAHERIGDCLFPAQGVPDVDQWVQNRS